MFFVLLLIAAIVAILLTVIVLLQSSKGGGLSGTFGGGAQMGAMFGSRRTADFLSKATWWMAGIIVGITLIANLFFLPGATSMEQRESVINPNQQPTLQDEPTMPTAPPTEMPSNNGENSGGNESGE